MTSGRPGRGSRGSVLMLMPAAVLIVLLLGAIAVDTAAVYLRQREVYNVAFDAANDAAGAGIDLATARRSGQFVLDPARVRQLAATTVAVSGDDGMVLVEARVEGDEVVVTVQATVHHVFAPVFGTPGRGTVRMTARATGETRSP